MHSHRKRKDSLVGSLNQVLFATESEFLKILVPRLPQNTLNVNIDCARKSKQVYSLCDQLLGVLVCFKVDKQHCLPFCWFCRCFFS